MLYLQVLYAFFSTVFFAIMFNLTGRKILYSSINGALGWFTHLFFFYELKYTKTASYLIAAIVITIFAEAVAKKEKNTVTSTLIPALIPLVPGGGIYYTMSNFVENNLVQAFAKGKETLFLTVALSVGIFLVSTFSQIFYRTLKYSKVIKKYRYLKNKNKVS